MDDHPVIHPWLLLGPVHPEHTVPSTYTDTDTTSQGQMNSLSHTQTKSLWILVRVSDKALDKEAAENLFQSEIS